MVHSSIKHFKQALLSTAVGFTTLFLAQLSFAQDLDPNFFYYFNGQVVGPRGFSVSDPDKWSGVGAVDFAAISKGSKVEMTPTDYKAKNDAIKVTWTRKKMKGVLSLNASPENATDLSAYKDIVALAFEIKIDRHSKKAVQLGLDCGYPCGAEIEVGRQLRELKKGEWSLFWMPLNCFKSDNFDLTKISTPFKLSTDGKMEISVANIRLERLPEGFAGCAEE